MLVSGETSVPAETGLGGDVKIAQRAVHERAPAIPRDRGTRFFTRRIVKDHTRSVVSSARQFQSTTYLRTGISPRIAERSRG
jgi:hypothetical protein